MSKGNFGQRLKREREMRGVSRAEICAATRIGTRFLEALENEQWEVLPGGIFNRGFIRAVARFLGLDEDDLVAEYDLAVSEQAPAAPALVSATLSAEDSTQTRSPDISRGSFCARFAGRELARLEMATQPSSPSGQ